MYFNIDFILLFFCLTHVISIGAKRSSSLVFTSGIMLFVTSFNLPLSIQFLSRYEGNN